MRIAAAIAALLVATAAAAAPASVRLGDLTISYDDSRWRISDISGLHWVKGPAIRLMVVCTDREDCWEETLLFASVAAETVPAREEFAGMIGPFGQFRDYGTRDLPIVTRTGTNFGGIVLYGYQTFGGCRARTPPRRTIFGSLRGQRYVFATGMHFGCGGVEGVPEPMIAELLAGISVVQP